MSTLRRILVSRANAALSKGPKTPSGKQRAARNATGHGLLARSLVLENESPEGFAAVMADHIARLNPVDGVEYAMIEEMVASHWRLRRAWAIEARMLEKQIAAQTAAGDLDRTADAFSALADTPATALLHRYEARLHLMYQRAMHNLLLLRVIELPNEPSPVSGHSAEKPLTTLDHGLPGPDAAAPDALHVSEGPVWENEDSDCT